MTTGHTNGSSNGQLRDGQLRNGPLRTAASRGTFSGVDDQTILDAIERAHEFPGYYPIVVIARREVAFEARLHAAVESSQHGAPYRIRERQSRQGNYSAYRVEIYVESAEMALARKAALAALAGVLLLL